eukprot:1121679-Rhodomonas_salina.1
MSGAAFPHDSPSPAPQHILSVHDIALQSRRQLGCEHQKRVFVFQRDLPNCPTHLPNPFHQVLSD